MNLLKKILPTAMGGSILLGILATWLLSIEYREAAQWLGAILGGLFGWWANRNPSR